MTHFYQILFFEIYSIFKIPINSHFRQTPIFGIMVTIIFIYIANRIYKHNIVFDRLHEVTNVEAI